jgi:hypothetical protein
MVDLVVVAANVALVAGVAEQVTFGATITQGQSVYLDTADSKWKLAQADGTALEAGSAGFGIALTSGANNQLGLIFTTGEIDLGVSPALGNAYVISATAGGIAPVEDLVATNRVTYLGYGNTATNLVAMRAATGELHP